MDLSVLRYIGKKDLTDVEYKLLIDKLNKLNIKSYCEPFSGSFNIGLNLIEYKFKGKVYLNDFDYNIFNFWNQLRDNYKLLYDNIINLYDKLMKIENKVIYIEKLRNSNNNLDRASGEYIFRHFNTVNGINISDKTLIKNELDFYLNYLYIENIEISNLDYKDIIDKLNSYNNFLFIDPPYKLSSNRKYYEKNQINHIELHNKLKNIKSKFILTYNDTEEIRYLYRDYNIIDRSYNNRFKGKEIWIHNM